VHSIPPTPVLQAPVSLPPGDWATSAQNRQRALMGLTQVTSCSGSGSGAASGCAVGGGLLGTATSAAGLGSGISGLAGVSGLSLMPAAPLRTSSDFPWSATAQDMDVCLFPGTAGLYSSQPTAQIQQQQQQQLPPMFAQPPAVAPGMGMTYMPCGPSGMSFTDFSRMTGPFNDPLAFLV
jgi:hypothetical protein